jgi:hypothetical protein
VKDEPSIKLDEPKESMAGDFSVGKFNLDEVRAQTREGN